MLRKCFSLFKYKKAERPVFNYNWDQDLYLPNERYLYCGFPEFEGTKILRDKELENPAPFSRKTLIPYHNFSASGFECPVDFGLYKDNPSRSYISDVPILGIIGAGTINNLNNYRAGMSYREILFNCLHGAGLSIESLSFLIGEEAKSNEMPHTRILSDRKTRSCGALTFIRFGDYYFSSHGHQRTIFAMYAIWQAKGMKGVIKNVAITEWFRGY